MSQTVIGIFDNPTDAQKAVSQLVSKGFLQNNIDISAQSSQERAAAFQDKEQDDDSIGGFFKSLFGSDEQTSNKYASVARAHTLVTVHAQTKQEAQQAADVLDEYGALDIDERAAQYSSSGRAGSAVTSTEGAMAIPIIEEELQVGKRVVETGGVRLRSRIIERPVEEHLRLREERVYVERRPVNRPASDQDLAGFKEGMIEVSEHAEVPLVSKEARIVEEVKLSKEVKEREEVIKDTVRKTDVDVEQLKTDDLRDRPANL
ncbi:YsnF/AvaK domain-containing protein [Rhodocytophaga aerolata]|uniref:YsnF/AvaK domain-containing protein n=1 Tax=Rhodocytophaga aerolata TaxID=455078 RepID=A0ABT8RJV6_9BACT|nr:YsnF/AvaK domain-containing protein [Rhodocytophaga aerolata]MDO1451270.1 YsnF/AvaK domain-containing protein [Rhodocytophaga aerolata]